MKIYAIVPNAFARIDIRGMIVRLYFKILTAIWVLWSLFGLIIPIVLMFAKGNVSGWLWYMNFGLKSIPDGIWGLVLDSNKYPNWLTFVYWIALIGTVFMAWRPKQKNEHV